MQLLRATRKFSQHFLIYLSTAVVNFFQKCDILLQSPTTLLTIACIPFLFGSRRNCSNTAAVEGSCYNNNSYNYYYYLQTL